MTDRVKASIAAVLACGGCSLIYNPSNLPDPPGDGPADIAIPIDSNPLNLTVDDVSPRVLVEGQGVDGSRRAIVIVHGSNFIAGATVAITAHAGETGTPTLIVDNASSVVSSDGTLLAIPVTVSVDSDVGPAPAAVASIRLDVAVTQSTPSGDLTKSITSIDVPATDTPILTLQGLPELSGSPTLATNVSHTFSKVDVVTITATGGSPLVVESTSSIKISGTVAVNGVNNTPGPGGNPGGLGGTGALGADGLDGGGPAHGQHNGGGGGFGAVGGAGAGVGGGTSGDISLHVLGGANVSSGGGGNKGNILNIEGGRGGGGGGSIALTAAGNLTFAEIQAKGGDGTSASNTTGGGGSGGAVIVRAGGSITVTGANGIVATGGTGAGVGGDGRVRFDAGLKATTVASSPLPGYRGPMLDSTTPLVVRTATPMVTFNGSAGPFQYNVEDEAGANTKGPFSVTMPSGGSITQATQALFPGLNKVCVLVLNATTENEGKNCITVVFVP